MQLRADINHLNSLLRGEWAAVEAYDECLSRLDVPDWVPALLRISDLGGVPSNGSGTWGRFARWVEAGARLFGPASALAALEGGEEYGKDYYERVLPTELSVETRAFVAIRLLPEQRRTLASLRQLRGRDLAFQ
jgi:hypothetical protein